MKNKKHDGKHLTISQRIIIEKGLGDHESFKAIATRIGKDPTTVAKEVKNHIFESVKSDKYGDIPCQYSLNCKIKGLCADSCCKTCKTCTKPHVRCKDICPKYTEKTCGKLDKAPYVCNGRNLDGYTQDKITLMINHVNSEARDSLNGCTPFKLSQMLLDNKLHSIVNLKEIHPDEVTLIPDLLK